MKDPVRSRSVLEKKAIETLCIQVEVFWKNLIEHQKSTERNGLINSTLPRDADIRVDILGGPVTGQSRMDNGTL
jgi:hypothetical protein